MKVISDTLDFQMTEDSAVTLGKFDGVHRGHQKLMRKILEQKADGLKSVAFTFSKMPGTVFSGEKEGTILTARERKRHLSRMGIDYMVECPFTEEFIRMEPERFIEEIIVKKLRARYVAVGTDFRFGYQRRGDCGLLCRLADRYGYRADVLEKECFGGRAISSSRVREELSAGNMETVEKLLGYPYYLSGTVVHGNSIGRTIGFPTANIVPDEEKLLPPNGVYLTKTVFDGEEHFGITNIGVKPTVADGAKKGVETHLFDFDGNLYGKELTVQFYSFERRERRFESLKSLTEQLRRDIGRGREKCNGIKAGIYL